MPLPDSGAVYVTATTMTFAGIVACQVGNAFACRSERESILQLGFATNRTLLAGIAVELTLLVLLLYVSPLARLFGLEPLLFSHWVLLAAFGPLLLQGTDAFSERDSTMKVFIFGAAGCIGRCLVSQALAMGHEVTALLRGGSSALHAADRRLRVVALDAVVVDAAVRGQDAVVFSLGRSSHRKPTTKFSDARRLLIRAMETQGVRGSVCITGIGAGESKRHGGFLYDRIILPFIMKGTCLDKDRREELIRQSSLDSIIVRPASFTNDLQRENLRVATELAGITIRSISRADVAAFVLDLLASNQYLRKTPPIGYWSAGDETP